jgi:uncharacterized protein (DUF1330 family)
MKKAYAIAIALVTGIGIGGMGVQTLHAQAKPPAYTVGEIDVKDEAGFTKEYLPKVQGLIKEMGGKYLAAGKAKGYGGDPPKSRIVVLQWASMDQADQYLTSDKLKEFRKIGEKYASFRNYAIEGVSQ